jgi:hypothetical protein
MSPTTKPKIGFSIDSIVGNRNKNKSPIHFSQDSEGSEAPLSPLSDYGYQQKSPKFTSTHADIQRALRLSEYSQLELHNRYKRSMSTSPISGQTELMEQHKNVHHRLSEQENHIQRHDMQKRSMSPEMSPRTHLSADESNNRRSRSPPSPISSPQHVQKGPIIVPGIPANIMRPSPIGPPQHQMPQGYTPEMIASQNHFFRLGTFKLLPT